MRNAAFVIAIVAVVLVTAAWQPAAAQTPLPYEIRTFMEPYPPIGAPSLADITWHQSNLRKQYVCPVCGFSTNTAGTCPDVWGIHGGAVSLLNLGSGASAQRDRVINVPEWDMPVGQADLMWYDYAAGSQFYRTVVGMPFHPTTNGLALPYDPPDPRGYGKRMFIRAAIQIGAGLDVNNDGTIDILPNAAFRFLVLRATWPSVTVPINKADAEARGWPSAPRGVSLQGLIDGSALNVPPIPLGSYGIGRIYMEWLNPGEPLTDWHFDVTPDGQPTTPLSTAFYVSRLQVPPGEMLNPPAVEAWRNGVGPGTAGPAEQPGSYLARFLIGPLRGGLRDDMYTPGATTMRRSFTVINRGDQYMVERLESTLLGGITTAPGLRAAGRSAIRPTLPDSAIIVGPNTIGTGNVAAKAIDTSHWVQARIPSYQPASEPGATLGHTPDMNWGYRGLALLYSDRNGNGRWTINLSSNLDSNGDTVDEFAPFDVQLSVDRQARLAADTSAAEPGRVAPGVPANSPDTTVGNPPIYGRFAYPSNVALTDGFTVSNEGNVVTPVLPLIGNQATAEPVGVSAKYRSFGRLLTANPVWLPWMPYTTIGTLGFPAGWNGDAGGWGIGGASGMGTSANPLPLGQGTGQYSSQVVYFLDVNGNGQLDFVNSLNGVATDTGSVAFDARRDEPLEPTTYVPTALRVTESRLPYNDFYAADTEPTLRFDYGAGGVANLQVMWVSNRHSVATGGGNVNVAAPAATSPAQAAQPAYPGNILFANATPVVVGGAPDYRPYVWDAEARNLTGTTAAANPGSVNGSPETFNDLTGHHWALWQRSLRQGAGVSTTLQTKDSAAVTWPGVDNSIYATGLPKQGIRGFADPTGSGLWLFWTEGDQGHQTLHYRWDYTGIADNQEALVPITNAVTPEWRSDVLNDFASAAPMRKPSTSPFVYTKDPTAFLWTPPAGITAGTQVHVVFSGYAARQQNEDICWAAFDQASMNDATQNFGKLTFPRVVDNPVLPATSGTTRAGEQLVGDGLRQSFSSRHLDWLTTPTFETAAPDARDPRFYVGLVSSAAPATPALYSVSWGPGVYNRARGVYVFTPVLAPLGGAGALPAGVETVAGSGILRNPLGPTGASTVPVPLTMQVEPSTGTVTFSGALFNSANPSDTGAVFNRTLAGLGSLTNVALYADYTPFVFRITTSDAADDSPNAFAEADSNDPNQLRLVFLWRRSYSQKDTPNFGRTDFMYKTWTLGTQVAGAPFGGAPTVAGWTGGGWAPLTAGQAQAYTVNAGSGIVSMVADGYRSGGTAGVFWLRSIYDGARIRVSYNGGLVEEHRIIGWSRETPAPVDTVQNEGPLRAVPEIYTVSSGLPAVRYWLIWSSPRAIYDLRLAANNGSVLHQSSDVYVGTIVPRYGAVLREQEVEYQNVQR